MANPSAAQVQSVFSGVSDARTLRDVLDLVPDGVLAFDPQYRYTIWNTAMERISGVSRSQVLGRIAFDVFPFLREIGEDQHFTAALNGEVSRSVSRRYNVAEFQRSGLFDGEYHPLFNDREQIVGGLAIIHDRKEDEKALLETLLQTGEIVAGELDLERIVQAVTDAATKATGAQFGAFFYNVINQKGESYMLYTLSGVPREAFSKFPMPRNTAVFAPTFNGEGVVRSDDITADPRYGHNAPHHGQPKGHLPVRSYLAVPVQARSGEVLGGLFFGHSQTAVFAASSEKLVAAMAKQAAIAIENARLYEQQRIARQLAEESESRANAIWSSISDAFVFFDPDWRYAYVNDKGCELAGKPREDLIGNNFWRLFPNPGGELHRQLEASVSQKQAAHFEVFFEPWRCWLECHCYPSADGLALYARDITAQRDAEQALRKAEDRLRLVADSTEIGMWYCDLPFDELTWSDKTKEHFWMPATASVKIQDFWDRIHPEDRDRTSRAIESSINQGIGYDVDYRTVSPTDGRIKWVRAIGRAFYDANGKPIRFDGITLDTTDRKLAEEALRRSEKLAAAGRLSATIAHEINNPLAAVTNLLFLARSSDQVNEIHNCLDVADQELKRVAHITKQTLGFYKDSGAPSQLKIADLVEQVLSIYRRRLESRNQFVDLQLRCPDATTVGNSGELRQVVSNLIANAIDAMSDGGRMVLRVSANDHIIRVTVADNGTGISEVARQHLFEPFHTTKTDVGTGLGLWVSRQLIQNHGGSIRFHTCTRPGQSGTAFSFTVPRSK